MSRCRTMSASVRARERRKPNNRPSPCPREKKNGDEEKASQQELPLHRVASEVDGKPKPAAQRNFTDPDSCIMVKDGAYIQAYNAQIVVDAAHQVIIAHGVSNQPPDQEYLVPMVERMLGIFEGVPEACWPIAATSPNRTSSTFRSEPLIPTSPSVARALPPRARRSSSPAQRSGLPCGRN